MKALIKCPACGAMVSEVLKGYATVFECVKCGAIHGRLSLSDSYKLVAPQFHPNPDKAKNVKYYDFVCDSAKGLIRRHGWFDVKTRLIVQVG